jgi:hypothetical protein
MARDIVNSKSNIKIVTTTQQCCCNDESCDIREISFAFHCLAFASSLAFLFSLKTNLTLGTKQRPTWTQCNLQVHKTQSWARVSESKDLWWKFPKRKTLPDRHGGTYPRTHAHTHTCSTTENNLKQREKEKTRRKDRERLSMPTPRRRPLESLVLRGARVAGVRGDYLPQRTERSVQSKVNNTSDSSVILLPWEARRSLLRIRVHDNASQVTEPQRAEKTNENEHYFFVVKTDL